MNLIKAVLCAFIAFLLIFLPWTNGFQSLKKRLSHIICFFLDCASIAFNRIYCFRCILADARVRCFTVSYKVLYRDTPRRKDV